MTALDPARSTSDLSDDGGGSIAPRPLPMPPVPLVGGHLVEVPETVSYRLKRRFLGPPLHTEALEEERLGNPTALAVFA